MLTKILIANRGKMFMLLGGIWLFGCSTTTQTSSGQEYLRKYQNVPVTTAASGDNFDIETEIRKAAAVEPVLTFPARIGLARIENGNLSAIPPSEGEAWKQLQLKLGDSFGEFIPVSPLVAKMVASSVQSSAHHPERLSIDIINEIRLGAARQHVDAVLIYEVFSKESRSDNILSVGKVTIIGGFILPSEMQEAQGFADGLLIDVIQGYPYGTIQTVVDKETKLSSAWGWGGGWDDREAFSQKVKTQAAIQLSGEAYDMFMKLRADLAKKYDNSKPDNSKGRAE